MLNISKEVRGTSLTGHDRYFKLRCAGLEAANHMRLGLILLLFLSNLKYTSHPPLSRILCFSSLSFFLAVISFLLLITAIRFYKKRKKLFYVLSNDKV